MRQIAFRTSRILGLVIAVVLVGSPAFAEKPAWGGGEGEKHEQDHRADHQRGHEHGNDERSRSTPGVREDMHFGDQHRIIVHDYYAERFRAGHCPPGLAKKHSGCMPPGQAKKWAIGAPLPRDVIFYDVPRTLVVRLGPPPAGYRYVRVAGDILMIAIGTGIVADAIQDLGGM